MQPISLKKLHPAFSLSLRILFLIHRRAAAAVCRLWAYGSFENTAGGCGSPCPVLHRGAVCSIHICNFHICSFCPKPAAPPYLPDICLLLQCQSPERFIVFLKFLNLPFYYFSAKFLSSLLQFNLFSPACCDMRNSLQISPGFCLSRLQSAACRAEIQLSFFPAVSALSGFSGLPAPSGYFVHSCFPALSRLSAPLKTMPLSL